MGACLVVLGARLLAAFEVVSLSLVFLKSGLRFAPQSEVDGAPAMAKKACGNNGKSGGGFEGFAESADFVEFTTVSAPILNGCQAAARLLAVSSWRESFFDNLDGFASTKEGVDRKFGKC